MNILAVLNVGLALFGFVLFWGHLTFIFIVIPIVVFCFDSFGLAGTPIHPVIGALAFFGCLCAIPLLVISKIITSFIYYRLDFPDLYDLDSLNLSKSDYLIAREVVLIGYICSSYKAGMWGERTCDHAVRCLNGVNLRKKLNSTFQYGEI